MSENHAADFVLTGAAVVTMDPAQPRAGALAVRDGVIVAVGNESDIEAWCGARTRRMHCAGATVMPGLVDGHCHPVKGAVADLFSAKFAFDADADAIAAAVTARITDSEPETWIIGGRWDSSFFDNAGIESPRHWLDRLSTSHAIYLRDDTGHNCWVNSSALARAGITADSVDPPGGRIGRDAAGREPNGLLYGAAESAVRRVVPDWTPAQYDAGVDEMSHRAHAFGITAITDADASVPLLAAYQRADAAGRLGLHVVACLSTPYGPREVPLDYAGLAALRDRFRSPRLDTRWAKIYLDGVPTAARTAAMLAPYQPHADFADDCSGSVHVEEALLAADIAELERLGFTVKLHTAGDRAVRVSLNAIEQAHVRSGRSDLRHELAHAGFVAAEDIPRFAAVNAAADLSPYLWFPAPVHNSVREALGERADRYWPLRDMLDAGVTMFTGSDWPAAVRSMDPWPGIEGMVTRRAPGDASGAGLWPQQALTLVESLHLFTRGGARAQRRDHLSGSLSAGKVADLIVLDRDLFAVPPQALAATRVRQTFVAGELVYASA